MCTHHDDDNWPQDMIDDLIRAGIVTRLPKPTPVHDTDPDEDAEDDFVFALTFTRFR